MGELVKGFLNVMANEPTFTDKVSDVFNASVKVENEKLPEGFEVELDGSMNLLTIINNLLIKVGEKKINLNRQTISRFQ